MAARGAQPLIDRLTALSRQLHARCHLPCVFGCGSAGLLVGVWLSIKYYPIDRLYLLGPYSALLGASLGHFLGNWIAFGYERMSSVVQRNLLDHGLLHIAMADNRSERLRGLHRYHSVWERIHVARALEPQSMIERLVSLGLGYSQCCLEFGLPAWPTAALLGDKLASLLYIASSCAAGLALIVGATTSQPLVSWLSILFIAPAFLFAGIRSASRMAAQGVVVAEVASILSDERDVDGALEPE